VVASDKRTRIRKARARGKFSKFVKKKEVWSDCMPDCVCQVNNDRKKEHWKERSRKRIQKGAPVEVGEKKLAPPN